MSETTTVLDRPEPVSTPEAAAPPRHRMATHVLVSALGVAMVCGAFALSRLHHPAAEAAFWAGQALTLAPIALWVLRRHPASGRSAATAVTLYAAWQCVLRWAYSPDAFRFSDELQHMRGTQNVIDTGHLFQFNLSLPVSTGYPGLEIIATQLTRLFGVDAFVAGTALAMAAHLLLPGCLVLLYREVTGSPRIAALAALLYLLNPNARFFDISFVYETLALPFLVLAILFAVRWGRGTHRLRNGFGWLASACLLVVTHHLSTAATAFLMLLLAALCMISADTRRIGAALALFGTLTAALLGGWIALAAPSTMDYVRTYGQQLVSGVGSLFGGSHGAAQSILASAPLSDRAMTATGVLLTTALLLAAAWRFRRSIDHLQRAFVIAGLSYGAIVGLRLALSEGAELSSRALTFVSIITAVGLAVAIIHLVDGAGEPTRMRTVGAVVAVLALLASGIATGVPSYWERLPGTFNIAGGPGSGIDNQNLDAAKWAARNLEPGARFFGNVTAVTVYSTYAALDPLRDPENLFYSTGFDPADAATVRHNNADYIVVDLRMARDLPVTGRYFTSDSLAGKHTTPIPLAALTKFETIPGIAKVFDSGDVRIYALRGSAYYGS